jgi:murein DD-endopeptidase MepM/ murein hydrolase activator NlpD
VPIHARPATRGAAHGIVGDMPFLLVALLLAAAAPAAAADRWRWPLRGDVLTPFHLAPNPFAAGQHRGVDIAAEAGARVRSACAGRVEFAGRVPGRGRAVSVLCGPLVATYLELGRTAVARGAPVAAGDVIGTVAASHLQLGARRAGDATGYVDPLTLLGPPPPPPLGAAPTGGRRGPPPAPAKRPAPVGAKRPVERPSPAPTGVPLAAWLGLALFLAGMPLGAVWQRRRRRTHLAFRAAR